MVDRPGAVRLVTSFTRPGPLQRIAVSPDGKSVYVNSGSRSDHGEVQDNRGEFPGVRETPLTSAIFRLPAAAEDIVLEDDEQELGDRGYLSGEISNRWRRAECEAFGPVRDRSDGRRADGRGVRGGEALRVNRFPEQSMRPMSASTRSGTNEQSPS